MCVYVCVLLDESSIYEKHHQRGPKNDIEHLLSDQPTSQYISVSDFCLLVTLNLH